MSIQTSSITALTAALASVVASKERAGLYSLLYRAIRREQRNADTWYRVWVTNKDYSSVVNAAFALGMLQSLLNEVHSTYPEMVARDMEVFDELNTLVRLAMQDIFAASGSITPYRRA